MRRVNILIIPYRGMRVISFNIPRYVLFILCFIFMFITGVGIWSAVGISKNIHEINRLAFLEHENETLKKKLLSIREKIKRTTACLDTLHRYENIVRFASSLTPLSEDVVKAGVGGQDIKEKTGIEEIDRILSQVDYLKRRYSIHSYYFQQEKRKVERTIEILKRTPSIKPAQGPFLSGFGYRIDPFTRRVRLHKGIDIDGPPGAPVVAAADGVVIFRGADAGYGLMVEIDHGYGVTTRYGHLSSIKVKLGERVKRGQIIGTIGNTGRSTGPHLHYEVRIGGEAVNPMYFIIKDSSVIN